MTTPRRPAAEILAGTVVVVVYAATMARTVTKWDSGEFLAAVYTLGIPHPPGTPLYVLLARVWAMVPSPLDFAVRVNLLSAIAAAAAVVLLGMLVRRWTGDRAAGVAAVFCAGATSTLWLAATEAEVYAPALLFAVCLLWVADRGAPLDCRTAALLVFLAGLAWTVHPAALVTVPAAVLLVLSHGPSGVAMQNEQRAPRAASRLRCPTLIAIAALLGVSAVLYLVIRAQHDPPINQGNPVTPGAMWDVLTRAQYAPVGFWPRQAPLWIQIGNWFEYADWQFALGLDPGPPPSWERTPVTLAFAGLGIVGLVAHARVDRRSWRALVLAFVSASLGVIVYLNLKAGPSFGAGFIAPNAPHEARERDYFFVASFVIWGAWAGLGAVVLARALARRFAVETRRKISRVAVATGVGIAALPLLLNWSVIMRTRALGSEVTRTRSLSLLASLPDSAVFLAIGDNDTYPLWYLQQVERVRTDVTVVTIPLLAATWYRQELARRYALLDEAAATRPSVEPTVELVCARAESLARPVVLSPYAPHHKFRDRCRESVSSLPQRR